MTLLMKDIMIVSTSFMGFLHAVKQQPQLEARQRHGRAVHSQPQKTTQVQPQTMALQQLLAQPPTTHQKAVHQPPRAAQEQPRRAALQFQHQPRGVGTRSHAAEPKPWRPRPRPRRRQWRSARGRRR